jgi:hypothetical protein
MSTITETNFGQVNLIATIKGVGFKCMGHGKHALKCCITDGEG